MLDFLFNYGLFTAKAVTLIVILLLGLATLLMIVASRGRERESIEIEKINDKFDSMRDAIEAEVLTKEEIKSLKKQRKKEEKVEAKALKKRLKSGETEPHRPRLFVLRFNGDMHASEVNTLREAITTVLLVAKPEDSALVILDSAGGLVHNYGLAASQLKRFREKNIHLTVAVDLIAASGGYLMACVANQILAAPFAVVGSIGVLAQIPNFNRLLEKYDIDIEQHTAGEYKTTLTMLGKNTDKARKKFQEELENTHVLFKNFVQVHRPELDLNKLATGEHWYGEQALGLRLIDAITTSDDYLVEKSKNTDIYEVNYVINETLSEKISTMFQDFSSKCMRSILEFFRRPAV